MVALESKLVAVKVHRRGATVTRRAEWTADGSVCSLSLSKLPLALHDDAVVVRVLEPQGAVVSGVHVGLYVPPVEALETPPDQVKLRQLVRQQDETKRRLAQLQLEETLLDGVEVHERESVEDGPPPPSPIQSRLSLEEALDGLVEERRAEAGRLRGALDAIEKEIRALRSLISRQSDAKKVGKEQVSKKVSARVYGLEAGARVVLELDYGVPGARWAPAYQLHVARDGASAQIKMRAYLAQKSGEDWSQVKLSLSTTDPVQWVEVPKLKSMRIGKTQPPSPPPPAFRPPPVGAGALFADYDRGLKTSSALAPQVRGAAAPSVPRVGALPWPESPEYGKLNLSESSLEVAMASEMEEGIGGGGMPPPSPPRSFSPPPAPAPGASIASSGLRARSPAPQKRKRARKGSKMEKELAKMAPLGESSFGGLDGPSGVPSFASLRLGRAEEHSTRGKLKRLDHVTRYLEDAGLEGRSLTFDLAQLLLLASQDAASVAHLPLPAMARDFDGHLGQYGYLLEAEDIVDLPSDGCFHMVPLMAPEAPCRLQYVVVPRMEEQVYRMAELENPTRGPLLPGPVEIYVAGEYVLTSALEMVAPGGRFAMGLGVEQAIKCARNTRFSERRSGRAVVATRELAHEISVELINRLGRAVECEVLERIPQPAEEAEVVVEEVEVSPGWTRYNQKDRKRPILGGRRWKVTLEPGGRQLLEASYVVKIYANNELVGGNRRES